MVLCCGGGAVSPSPGEENAVLGPRGRTGVFKGATGVQLQAYWWPCDAGVPQRGIVQLAHGNSTYTQFDFLKFTANGRPNVYAGSWVEAMNQAGYAVCAIDHQGYGRSKGARAYISRFHKHVDNCLHFSKHVREAGDAGFPAGLPYFLVGYSMGGMVALKASLVQPNWYAGLVLISPMVSLERRAQETRKLRPLLSVASTIAPRLPVGASTLERPVPWINEAREADALSYNGKVRARVAAEFFVVTEEFAKEGHVGSMSCVSVPLLVFQGERDTLVSPSGALALIERAATHDKRLRTVPAGWHVLTKEDGNEELRDELITWLSEHLGNERTLALFKTKARADGSGGHAAGKVKAGEEEGEGSSDGGSSASGQAEAAELPGATNRDADEEGASARNAAVAAAAVSAAAPDAAARGLPTSPSFDEHQRQPVPPPAEEEGSEGASPAHHGHHDHQHEDADGGEHDPRPQPSDDDPHAHGGYGDADSQQRQHHQDHHDHDEPPQQQHGGYGMDAEDGYGAAAAAPQDDDDWPPRPRHSPRHDEDEQPYHGRAEEEEDGNEDPFRNPGIRDSHPYGSHHHAEEPPVHAPATPEPEPAPALAPLTHSLLPPLPPGMGFGRPKLAPLPPLR